MFTPMVHYIVLQSYSDNPKAVGWFALHPTMQSLVITLVVLCEWRCCNPPRLILF